MMKVGNCLSGSLGFPFLFLCMHAIIYFNKQCYGRLTGSSAVVATLGEMGMGRRCNLIRESGSIRRARTSVTSRMTMIEANASPPVLPIYS